MCVSGVISGGWSCSIVCGAAEALAHVLSVWAFLNASGVEITAVNHTRGMKATGGRSVAGDCPRRNGCVCVYGVCDGVANAAKIAQPRKRPSLNVNLGKPSAWNQA